MKSEPSIAEPSAPSNGTKRANDRVIALACCAFVATMVGVAYAAVPLYELFCRVTGFGGTTQVATEAPATILDREITVRFDANIEKALPWDFQPKVRSVQVKIGEVHQVAYQAASTSEAPTWGTAGYNVTPDVAGRYFNKITCFCFNQQELAAGESVDMPVVFFVDPEIVNDKSFDYIDTITLSYTFYNNEPPEADTAAASGVLPIPEGSAQDERG